MNWTNFGIDAAVLYGSAARGDADHLSDRDLLLLGEDVDALERASAHFAAQGYSCAAYTSAKLDKMRAHGSLFVQHLKQEGRSLYDPAGAFTRIVSSFQPASSYEREMHEATEMFRVASRVAEQPDCLRWALDVLAVAFRNYAILFLAHEGKYHFSHEQIIAELHLRGKLTTEDCVTIARLRVSKSCFRARTPGNHVGDDKELFRKVARMLRNRFKIDLDERFVKSSQQAEHCFEAGCTAKFQYWYSRLRSLEGSFVALKPRREDSAARSIENAIQIRVNHPKCYTPKGKPSEMELVTLISDFAD